MLGCNNIAMAIHIYSYIPTLIITHTPSGRYNYNIASFHDNSSHDHMAIQLAIGI